MQHQKHLFSLPSDVHYLNCATMSPLLKSVEQAGMEGLLRKSQPYQITQDHFFDTLEVVKSEFAQLINAPDSQQIAVMGSVSYGMATVAKNIIAKGMALPGKKVVMVGEEFSSDVYAWDELKPLGVKMHFVHAPATLHQRGKRWNELLLKAIDTDTLMVCISPSHWSDGTLFDLEAVGARCRETGALFVIDGTQYVGAAAFDVQVLRPDALIVAAYKWLLGPYGSALAYLGPWLDDGQPLEQNWAMRKDSNDFKNLINYQDEYRPGAFRYNMGEVANFINLPMMAAALQQLNEWGPANIQHHAKDLISNHLETLRAKGYWIEDEGYRSHHLFGIRLPEGMDLAPVQQALLAEKVFVSYRGTAIRVSVNVWNDEEDMALFTKVLLHA